MWHVDGVGSARNLLQVNVWRWRQIPPQGDGAVLCGAVGAAFFSRRRNGHNRLTRPATGSLASGQQEHKADRPQHRQNDCAGDIRRVPSPRPAIA